MKNGYNKNSKSDKKYINNNVGHINNTSNDSTKNKHEGNTKKAILKEYISFYNKNLKFKHIVSAILMVIVFAICLKISLSTTANLSAENIEELKQSQISFFNAVIKEKIPLNFLIIFAGISPFLYISVIGIFSPYNLAISAATSYAINGNEFLVVIMCLGALIQIIGLSLSVATGMYYCSLSTKKYRYSQTISFGYKDVKKAIYEIRKDEKKVKQIDEEKRKKAEKREKLNVKVPYKMFVISFLIATIITIIGTIVLK